MSGWGSCGPAPANVACDLGRGEDLRDKELWGSISALKTTELGVDVVVFEHSARETQPMRGLRPNGGTAPSRRHCLKHMCRPRKSSGRVFGAAPSSILRSGLHTCFFCGSYPLLLRVTGRGISREPHWITPERNEQREPSADISVARRLGRECRRCRGIAPFLRKELVLGCDLLWATRLRLVGRRADHAQQRRVASCHRRARRLRSSGREGGLASREFARRGRPRRQLAELR